MNDDIQGLECSFTYYQGKNFVSQEVQQVGYTWHDQYFVIFINEVMHMEYAYTSIQQVLCRKEY